MSFVIGDKVVCVNESGANYLKINRYYEVINCSPYTNLVQVKNDIGAVVWCNTYRFLKCELEQKGKEMTERYEVVKPFDLLDIYKCYQQYRLTVNYAFEELLNDLQKFYASWDVGGKFLLFKKDILPRTIWEYRCILEAEGFIEKVSENITLKPGMRLKDEEGEYRLINCGEYLGEDYLKYCVLVENTDFLYNYGEVFTHRTLEELNEQTGESFEVINEEE